MESTPFVRAQKTGLKICVRFEGFLLDDLIGHWCFHSGFLLVEAIKHAVRTSISAEHLLVGCFDAEGEA